MFAGQFQGALSRRFGGGGTDAFEEALAFAGGEDLRGAPVAGGLQGETLAGAGRFHAEALLAGEFVDDDPDVLAPDAGEAAEADAGEDGRGAEERSEFMDGEQQRAFAAVNYRTLVARKCGSSRE